MIVASNIFKRYGPVRVLSGASFSIDRRQKIALVGPNGVGKSTLLRILAGLESEDKGRVTRNRRILIGYLPQEIGFVSQAETVINHFRCVAGIDEIEREMNKLEDRLADERLLVRYGELQEDYERLGGYVFEEKARRALDGLALQDISLDRLIGSLSGGERRRVALAAVLTKGVDLLLLDEPTNDLDLEAIFFLEKYLQDTEAAVLIASHDRTFLDHVVDRVLEIDWYFRTTHMFSGNWSAYRTEKAEMLRRAQELHERNESERYRLRGTAEEKKVWARIGGKMVMPDRDKMSQGFHRNRSEQKFHAAAKALSTRARKVKEVAIPPLREELAVLFAPQSGEDRGITLERVVAGYGDGGFVFGPIDLDLPYGTRMGIFARNGSGKSTILKTIAGVLDPVKGEVVFGVATKIGILDQECGVVPREKTALEWFARETLIREEETLSDYLGRFLLNPETISFRLGELSPGERMRMALAFFVATGVNVLILDEPTNHLDMEAIEALETALMLYQGTLLLVSHDRSFLSRVPLTRICAIGSGRLVSYPDYGSYLSAAESSAREGMKQLGFDRLK